MTVPLISTLTNELKFNHS